MYHSLFIHSPTEGYLGCFHVWTVMNKAAINTCVQVFVQTFLLFFPSLWLFEDTNDDTNYLIIFFRESFNIPLSFVFSVK